MATQGGNVATTVPAPTSGATVRTNDDWAARALGGSSKSTARGGPAGPRRPLVAPIRSTRCWHPVSSRGQVWLIPRPTDVAAMLPGRASISCDSSVPALVAHWVRDENQERQQAPICRGLPQPSIQLHRWRAPSNAANNPLRRLFQNALEKGLHCEAERDPLFTGPKLARPGYHRAHRDRPKSAFSPRRML